MIGQAASTTNVPKLLKTLWEDKMQDMFYENAPALAMFPKASDWDGLDLKVTVQYGQVNGRSTIFGTAQQIRQPTKQEQMTMTTADNFAVWQVEHKLIQLSRTNKGSLVRALESQTKSAFKKFKRSMCWMLYGNGGGSIGVLSAAATGTGADSANLRTLTFSSASSMRNIDVGDVLVASANDGTQSGHILLNGEIEVTQVKTAAKQVLGYATTGLTAPGATSWPAGTFIFPKGDFDKGTNVVMKGLETYVPPAEPTTPLWGMDRTKHTSRLGGLRVGGKGLLVSEALRKGLKTASDEGADIDKVFCSTTDFMNLDLQLGTQKVYADVKVANVGFTGIKINNGSSRPVEVFADPDCPVNIIWGLQMDTWKIHSAGEYPDFLTIDGRKYEPAVDAPTFEGRIGGYAQLYTDAPGYNFRLDLTAA